MDRRALLRRAAVAGSLAIAGCSGGEADAGSGYEDLTVDDFETSADEDGNLVVTVVVANTAAETRRGTLYVNAETGDGAETRVRTVEVGPAGTAEVEARFDVSEETFNQAGSLNFDWDEA